MLGVEGVNFALDALHALHDCAIRGFIPVVYVRRGHVGVEARDVLGDLAAAIVAFYALGLAEAARDVLITASLLLTTCITGLCK